MTLFAAVLQVLVPLFALILLGFVLRRYASVLHLGHLPSFTGLVVNVTLPALVLLAIVRAPSIPALYARLPVAIILAEAVTMTVAFVVGRAMRLARPMLGMLMMTACFGNTAFLGYPIVLSLVPRAFPAAVVLDQFGMTLPMLLTAGILGGVLGEQGSGGDGSGEERATGSALAAFRRWVRSPIFLSAALALTLRLVPWPHGLVSSAGAVALGKMFAQTLSYLGQATTPIALLALGAALQPRTASASWRFLLLPCAFKLIVDPVVMWFVCRAFGFHGDLLHAGVIQASMSTSVVCSLLCVQYKMEGVLAGGAVFVTTVLSLLTVPLLFSLLR